MKNIYLIGFMGAVKSAVSKVLCEEYNLIKMEMDETIEREENMSIPDIFSIKGEEYFREKETALLKKCTGLSDLVVSCGGGAAMRERNVAEMKKNGMIVWLNVSAETVFKRVKDSHNRPLLEGNMNIEYIEELLQKRKSKYMDAADVTINTDGKTLKEISKEIIERCR